MDILQNFAILEGPDGSGTSTQMELLKQRFAAAAPGRPVLHTTAEPTGGELGQCIRRALKGELPLRPETLARLFAADRGEHLYGKGGIVERANRGELVVCDRYVPSSLVYQGLECGEELPRSLNSPFPAPRLIIFFDLDPRIAAERIKDRGEREIYEYLEFQIKVRDRYLSLLPVFRAQGSAIVCLDASRRPEEVAAELWAALKTLPALGGQLMRSTGTTGRGS
ncbi:MAG: dTMP kinase [Treponema sp.]|jgi:dTMP kinase|nr:dTMP kinase [Treponema sp.]